jgi:hypothetical protein
MEIRNYTHDEMDAEFQRRVAVVHYLSQSKTTDYRQLWRLVAAYYKEPMEVMKRIEASSAPATPAPVPAQRAA